eukprot:3914393-Prymnesium_polylepis.1
MQEEQLTRLEIPSFPRLALSPLRLFEAESTRGALICRPPRRRPPRRHPPAWPQRCCLTSPTSSRRPV